MTATEITAAFIIVIIMVIVIINIVKTPAILMTIIMSKGIAVINIIKMWLTPATIKALAMAIVMATLKVATKAQKTVIIKKAKITTVFILRKLILKLAAIS